MGEITNTDRLVLKAGPKCREASAEGEVSGVPLTDGVIDNQVSVAEALQRPFSGPGAPETRAEGDAPSRQLPNNTQPLQNNAATTASSAPGTMAAVSTRSASVEEISRSRTEQFIELWVEAIERSGKVQGYLPDKADKQAVHDFLLAKPYVTFDWLIACAMIAWHTERGYHCHRAVKASHFIRNLARVRGELGPGVINRYVTLRCFFLDAELISFGFQRLVVDNIGTMTDEEKAHAWERRKRFAEYYSNRNRAVPEIDRVVTEIQGSRNQVARDGGDADDNADEKPLVVTDTKSGPKKADTVSPVPASEPEAQPVTTQTTLREIAQTASMDLAQAVRVVRDQLIHLDRESFHAQRVSVRPARLSMALHIIEASGLALPTVKTVLSGECDVDAKAFDDEVEKLIGLMRRAEQSGEATR